MLCEKCSNIVLRPHSRSDKHLWYHLYDTLRLLRLSAQTCHLCRHVVRNFYRKRRGLSKLDSSGPIYIIYSLPHSEQDGERPFALDPQNFKVCCLHSKRTRYLRYEMDVELFAVDETCFDVPETFEPAQAHDNNLFSARTIQFAKQRMNRCSRSHPTCSSTTSLPLWVIEIADSGSAAKLVPGAGRVAHYVTLSYKWGEAARYTMTIANRSFLRHEIPLDQLPKTFSDAIELTHKLGHKYLWIDALCITQDDSRELGEQIAAMENIYSGSDVTIFAAGGDDANWGLNRTRDATMVYPIQVKLRAELPWPSTTVSKTIWISDPVQFENFRFSPLYQRGWVLQEQLLSRRGLVFNHKYVTWRCLRDNVSELFPFDCKDSLVVNDHTHIEPFLRDCDGLAKSRKWFWAKSTDDFHKADFPLEPYYRSIELKPYYRTIERYVQRTLTFKSDVLPAIAGLVAMTEQRTGSKFYYGTCLQDAKGFLWSTSLREDEPVASRTHPSWAWTICLGYRGTFLHTDGFCYTWQVAEHHNTRNRGGLEIISWTQWVTLHMWDYSRPGQRWFTPKGRDRRGDVCLDLYYRLDQEEFTDDQLVLCIFVANSKGRNYALLAEPCRGEKDTFVRIGLATHVPHKMFDVTEPVERRGAVMESQRSDDSPQRTIQHLV